MSVNIIELLKGGIGNSLVTHSADFLEENETETNDAVDGTFAALMASLIQKSATDDGAAQVLKVVNNSDDHILDNVEGLFTRSPQTINGLVTAGTRDLPAFIDGKQREASNQVSADSGIRKNPSAKLMRFSTPFLLSMINRQTAGQKLDAGGLRTFLNGQKPFVKSHLSDDMINTLELSEFGWTKKNEESKKDREAREARERAERKRQNREKRDAERAERQAAAATPVVTEEVATTGTGFKWWWIVLPLLLLGLLGLLFGGKGCSTGSGVSGVSKTTAISTQPVTTAVEKVAETTTTAVETVKETATNAFSNVNEAAKGALDKITFAAGSAGNQMMDFIKGGEGEGRFRFNNLTFDSGSAAISGESGVEADNIAAILKAYPDVNITIEGYTDNRGNADSNKQLSRKRAVAVKQRLAKSGVNGPRMKVKGFGDANPIADNETAEGRALNRRIEVVVDK